MSAERTWVGQELIVDLDAENRRFLFLGDPLFQGFGSLNLPFTSALFLA